MTLELAARLVPCPDCSRPGRQVSHGIGACCPFRTRERAVPCRSATLRESMRGQHFTFAEDRVCDACRVKMPAARKRATDFLLAASLRDGASSRTGSATGPAPSPGVSSGSPDAAVAAAARTVARDRGTSPTGPSLASSSYASTGTGGTFSATGDAS